MQHNSQHDIQTTRRSRQLANMPHNATGATAKAGQAYLPSLWAQGYRRHPEDGLPRGRSGRLTCSAQACLLVGLLHGMTNGGHKGVVWKSVSAICRVADFGDGFLQPTAASADAATAAVHDSGVWAMQALSGRC